MTQVSLATVDWFDLLIVIDEHKELTIANSADFSIEVVTVLKFNRIWKLSFPVSTFGTNQHGTEFTLYHVFVKFALSARLLTGIAVVFLSLLQLMQRLVICHCQLEDFVIWVELMGCSAIVDSGRIRHHYLILLDLMSLLALNGTQDFLTDQLGFLRIRVLLRLLYDWLKLLNFDSDGPQMG